MTFRATLCLAMTCAALWIACGRAEPTFGAPIDSDSKSSRLGGETDELVLNPSFTPDPSDALPASWTDWEPEYRGARCRIRTTPGGLIIDAPHRPYAVGGVLQSLQGIVAGKAYQIAVHCAMRDVPAPYRAVAVRVDWLKKGKLLHPAGMLARGPEPDGDRWIFRDVLVAPAAADGANLVLEVKWPQGGAVCFADASVRPTTLPPPRKVKVGTVYLKPNKSTPEENMNLFCAQVDEAGRLGLDIVCLPEAMLQVGTKAAAHELAEPIPGRATERLGKAAKKNRLWLVAGLAERDGDNVYNTAVLIDREGKLAGKYRKVHLPREEWKKGITPGSDYPVFETDFGKVAIQICYDWFFPETDTIFGLKGAEIVFAPTWGDTSPDEDGRPNGETVFRVRARDNGIFLVPSVYDGSSMVIDPMGRILASNKGTNGVVWAEVDLSQREALKWVGYWRSITPRDRMPETYDLLNQPVKGTNYGRLDGRN